MSLVKNVLKILPLLMPKTLIDQFVFIPTQVYMLNVYVLVCFQLGLIYSLLTTR
jgi:hypothetical protein